MSESNGKIKVGELVLDSGKKYQPGKKKKEIERRRRIERITSCFFQIFSISVSTHEKDRPRNLQNHLRS